MFEPRRCRRAAGEESGEARAELLFEPRRCRRAAGEESGEARAELMFEPRRCRRAAGEESGEARAEVIFEPRRCPPFELSDGLGPARDESRVGSAGVAVRAEGRSPEG